MNDKPWKLCLALLAGGLAACGGDSAPPPTSQEKPSLEGTFAEEYGAALDKAEGVGEQLGERARRGLEEIDAMTKQAHDGG